MAPVPARIPAVISLVPGTVEVELAVADMLLATLTSAGDALPPLPYYSVSDVRDAGDWLLVSLVGLSRYDIAAGWRLEDSAWVGVVVARRDAAGHWSGAVEGTPGFAQLLDLVPDSVIAPSAKASLDPARRSLQPAETYILPWQTGTSMYYGVLGVHNGDYAWLVGDYKGVDFVSDGDTSLGHAPNRLLAAASGAISYVCRDSYNLAIRIGNMMYVHLVDNPNLVVGHAFNQGEELGQLQTGSFSANCGHASQGDNWFHVHWTFPNTGVFQAGGWTLNWSGVADEDLKNVPWTRGTETRPPQTWLRAESVVNYDWHVEYFTDKTLGNRCFNGYNSAPYLFKYWDQAAPASGCPADGFGARFTRLVNFNGGDYSLHLEHEDGARLFVDGAAVIDAWAGGAGSHYATRALSGTHELKIETFDTSGFAALGAWWYGPGALPAAATVGSRSWRAEYFGNPGLWGRPVLVLNEGMGSLATGTIDHDWDSGGPGYNLPADNFSARFTRTVNLPCGHYHFAVHSDDGVRLWAGSQKLLDKWQGQVADFVAEADLPGGDVTLRVEYFEATGDAALSVSWEFISSVACAEAKPDLYPYTPVGYTTPVLVSAIHSTRVTDTLYAGWPAYFDWYFTNGGYASTSSDFRVELWIDDVLARRSSYSSFESGWVGGEQDWATTVVTPGLHLVRLVVDPANSVAESDETNNVWEGWFNWQAAPGTPLSTETRYHMFLPVMPR